MGFGLRACFMFEADIGDVFDAVFLVGGFVVKSISISLGVFD